MGFTGAANRVDASGGFGQGETRPQAFTGLNGKGYLIGRTQDRIIEIADISDPDTSTYVSAVIGNPNSMAAHNGSLYVFIGKDLIRFDTPFSDTDTGTDVFTIDETPRALTSDGTNLYYIHQLSTLNFLYRIDDLDGTPTVTNTGRVGDAINANIRGLVWHDGFFWGVDATTDTLRKIILSTDGSAHTLENVGSYSQFVGPITNPQGFGVVNGVGYISALDNEGSLWELRDFKFTDTIADQSWTVGTAVSVSAPATEDGATPITYAISPALVAGVTLDTSTGGISGTPTATADATDYTLTATDDNGIEATTTFSASVAASGGMADTAPAAPTDLSITVTATGATVSFTAGSDGGQAVTDTEYRIQEGTTIDDDTDWTSTGETDTDFEIDSLSKGTQYAIEIRQVNSIGNGTKSSLSTFTTDATPPNAPTSLSVTVGETTADLSWTAPSDTGGETITSYEVSSDDGATWADTGDADVSYQITGLTANTEYDFKVRAVNSEGSGTASSTVTETTDAAAVTPTLTWQVPSDAVGNTFSATLTSNVALDAAPTVDDLRLRDDDNSDPVISLNSTNTTITAVAGTNNYLIEISLTGTYDDDYTLRINGNTVEYNGAYVNAAQLASAVFSIDSSIGANNAPSFSESSYTFTDVAIAVNTVVGTVAATDADDDTLSYSLTGSDASDFAIDADGEITVATELTHSDTYTFNVVADDDTDTTSVAVTVTAATAAVSNLPVWQTGSALESSVDALASASIDITGKVSGETEVTALRGVLDWMEWDGSTLDITEAPIFRKDTVFRVRFRAKSADGSTDATYLLTVNGSRLIWMHSTLLCKPPIHYEAGRVEIRGTSTKVTQMTDNRYETHSTEMDVDVDVSDGSNATKIDAVAFVSKNVDSYSLTPTGGSGSGFSDRDVPSSFDTRDGRSQSRVLGGFQWEFYPLPAQITATSVRLQFSGTDVEMYAVMLLELLTEIRDGEFVDVVAEKVDRAGSVSENDNGRVDRASRLGAERWKWETQYLLNVGEKLTYDSEAEVLRFLSANPDVFCVQEAARYPARMHVAVVSNLELSPEQKGLYKGAGSIVPFSVAEV